jgi:hypothetical protein
MTEQTETRPTDEAIITILTILDFMGKLPETSGGPSQTPQTSFIQAVEGAYGAWAQRLAEHRAECKKITGS